MGRDMQADHREVAGPGGRPPGWGACASAACRAPRRSPAGRRTTAGRRTARKPRAARRRPCWPPRAAGEGPSQRRRQVHGDEEHARRPAHLGPGVPVAGRGEPRQAREHHAGDARFPVGPGSRAAAATPPRPLRAPSWRPPRVRTGGGRATAGRGTGAPLSGHDQAGQASRAATMPADSKVLSIINLPSPDDAIETLKQGSSPGESVSGFSHGRAVHSEHGPEAGLSGLALRRVHYGHNGPRVQLAMEAPTAPPSGRGRRFHSMTR